MTDQPTEVESDLALHQRIDWNMTNHAPIDDDVVARFEAVREFAKNFSHAIVDLCPEGRDRDLALTHAEDALMRAVASIARNQDRLVPMDGVTEREEPVMTSDELEEAAANALAPRETAPVEDADLPDVDSAPDDQIAPVNYVQTEDED